MRHKEITAGPPVVEKTSHDRWFVVPMTGSDPWNSRRKWATEGGAATDGSGTAFVAITAVPVKAFPETCPVEEIRVNGMSGRSLINRFTGIPADGRRRRDHRERLLPRRRPPRARTRPPA